MVGDGPAALIKAGVITNAKKLIHPGKSVFTFAYGSNALYDVLRTRDDFLSLDAGYVNDPYIIRSNPRVTAINAAIEVDITGQVAAGELWERPFLYLCLLLSCLQLFNSLARFRLGRNPPNLRNRRPTRLYPRRRQLRGRRPHHLHPRRLSLRKLPYRPHSPQRIRSHHVTISREMGCHRIREQEFVWVELCAEGQGVD